MPTGGGTVRVLDKQKAQSRELDLAVGQTVQFETLQIPLRACMVHPPLLPPDEAGFLQVTDSRESEPGFQGWMLSHEPAVAMMESPVYGVRVTGCRKPTDAAVAAAMPQREPAVTTPAAASPDTPGGTAPGEPAPAVPLAPAPSEPLDVGTPAPAGAITAPSPGRPAAPAQPAAPASGGIY